MTSCGNPYAFGIAPLNVTRSDSSDKKSPRINWTIADVIVISVSGVPGFAVWVLFGGLFALVMYDAAMLQGPMIRLAGQLLALFVLAMCFVFPGAIMLVTRKSIRRWKISRFMRSPAGLAINIEEPHE